jgi:hypothetical protein
MKYIKHSKYKNTGLIFELLVRQIASDTIYKKESPAVSILKKYYSDKSALGKEYKLYEFIEKQTKLNPTKAETVLTTVLEMAKRLNQDKLKSTKYDLIKEIKESYDLDEFFTIKVNNYKTHAALYCLMEISMYNDLIDPQAIVENKTTILEHLTGVSIQQSAVRDNLIEEYSKYDKDLRLLTYKILLEKFNKRYINLLPEQKNILRQFIQSVSSSKKLYNFVNEEMVKIKSILEENQDRVVDQIVKIKLQEVIKSIKPVDKSEKITDSHLVSLMQYYDLVSELKTV